MFTIIREATVKSEKKRLTRGSSRHSHRVPQVCTCEYLSLSVLVIAAIFPPEGNVDMHSVAQAVTVTVADVHLEVASRDSVDGMPIATADALH